MCKKFLLMSTYFALSFPLLNVVWVNHGNATWEIEVSSEEPFHKVKIWGGKSVWNGTRTAGEAWGNMNGGINVKTTTGWHTNTDDAHIWADCSGALRPSGSVKGFPYTDKFIMKKERELMPPLSIRIYHMEDDFCCCCLPIKSERMLSSLVLDDALPEDYNKGTVWTFKGDMHKPPLRIKITRKDPPVVNKQPSRTKVLAKSTSSLEEPLLES